jgi:hypothetical protein
MCERTANIRVFGFIFPFRRSGGGLSRGVAAKALLEYFLSSEIV